MSAVPACAALGVYKPRRPQASPLFRLVSDHFRAFQHAYDERFAPTYGDWRPVVREVADRFLEYGVLDHGFARVRCDTCTHEYLLAFSCKARYFCPSCHAKRLALWTLWLEDSLLVAGVPHRQVVLTIPKRLRAWCLYRRSLLGDLARVAARTVTAAVRALAGEPTLAVGIVGCIQTHGSLANWHPHLHMIATDGGFRPDGTFVSWPAHDTAQLSEAFRRAVLRLFVRLGLFEREDAEAMLAWPHSGFTCTTPCSYPTAIWPSRFGSRATARAIPWRLSGWNTMRSSARCATAPTRRTGPRRGRKRWTRWSSWRGSRRTFRTNIK